MTAFEVTEHFIGCDGRYCSAATTTFRNLRIARRVATDDGWLLVGDTDLCPSCAAETDEDES